ncbi:MAG: alpha/beta hydrolase [Deltaproteobacteria bacterium]|nr:alpha/beta hydrolase [Deltaproteobacteria bacterium]
MGRIKSLEEIKAMVRERTGKQNVFRLAKREDVEPVLNRLTSKDPELWAEEWSRVAKRYEEEGNLHDGRGEREKAREAYLMSYTYYTIGRYPVPHSPGKKECFRKSLELFVKAGRYFDFPMERLSIPYGDKVIPAYLRLPPGQGKRPVVINFGGIDSYKAECFPYDEALLQAGLGTCAVDMPGVGESPIKGSTTAESLFSSVIDYLENRPEIDRERIAILGRSFGGYWSAKMAFVELERLRASVVWGGGIHYFFQEQWQRKSTNAESYLMDHEIARAMAFGLSDLEEIAAYFPSLSLKTQGWFDKPSCPMLIVNGKDDLQTPIEDLYILLESGIPKAARVFPGGHMGQTPETFPTIVRWLKRELAESAGAPRQI